MQAALSRQLVAYCHSPHICSNCLLTSSMSSKSDMSWRTMEPYVSVNTSAFCAGQQQKVGTTSQHAHTIPLVLDDRLKWATCVQQELRLRKLTICSSAGAFLAPAGPALKGSMCVAAPQPFTTLRVAGCATPYCCVAAEPCRLRDGLTAVHCETRQQGSCPGTDG